MKIKKEIERLVKKYSRDGNEKLLKLELELLVVIAEREQMRADHKTTMKIINK